MKVMKEVFSWILSLGLAIVLALLIKHFIFEVTIVRQSSMSNTYLDGDVLIAGKMNLNDLHRGEIIVLRNPDRSSDHKFMIKRLIGMPGDRLELKDGTVYLNDKALDEPYVKGSVTPAFDQSSWEIPRGYVFAMGDNRSFSMDSRSFGPIPISDISSKVLFRLYPFSRFGPITLPRVWQGEDK